VDRIFRLFIGLVLLFSGTILTFAALLGLL
jgi:hypothetical protein